MTTRGDSQTSAAALAATIERPLAAYDRLSRAALATIIALAALVLGLLLVESAEPHWTDWPFHAATAVAQLVICTIAWRALTELRRLLKVRQAGAEAMARLRAEKEAAESVNLAKSRYLANVSHEIRSPLNSIYGYAQLVESDYGVEAREAARVIRRSAEHLSSLVEGLLDMAQVEHGVLRVNTEVVRLGPFLTQVLRMVHPSASSKGLELDLVTEGRLPEYVRIDAGRLRQVLLNLLGNAIKYTDSGKVTLYLRYASQIATFEVRDTGPGIALDEQATIFEPFERGGDSAQSRPGAGLGLSISRAIVGILGGDLELARSDENGSVFRVSLMLGEVVGIVPDQGAQRQVLGYEGRRRSILVVDDDPEQRSFIEHLLNRLGFLVSTAPDGATALALTAERTFDLALLDITMPGLSGWQLAGRLRDAQPKSLRIVMLSGNSNEMHGPEFRARMHDDFLVKPVEFSNLTRAIGEQLLLVWVVDMGGETSAEEPATAPASASPATLGDAASAHVRQLRELLRIGYLRGIEDEIGKLEQEAPQLARELYERLDRFDLPGMTRMLEEVAP